MQDITSTPDELLAGPPSSAAWAELCARAEGLGQDAVDRLLPRVLTWPAAVRTVPDAWWRELTVNRPRPWHRLAARRPLTDGRGSEAPTVLAATPKLDRVLVGESAGWEATGGGAHVWNTRSRHRRTDLQIGDGREVYDAAFTPDGALVALAAVREMQDGLLAVYDAGTGALRWQLDLTGARDEAGSDGESMELIRVALTADGRTVAAASHRSGRAVVAETATGEILVDLAVGASGPIALDRAGDRVAVAGSDRRLQVHDARTGAVLHRLVLPLSCHALAFAPDGGSLAVIGATDEGVLAAADIPLDGGSAVARPVQGAPRLDPSSLLGLVCDRLVWTSVGPRAVVNAELPDETDGGLTQRWLLVDPVRPMVLAGGSGLAAPAPAGRALLVAEPGEDDRPPAVAAWLPGGLVRPAGGTASYAPPPTPGGASERRPMLAVDDWQRLAVRTGPADREETAAGIRAAYQAAGLRPPEQVLWVDSPLQGLLAAELLVTEDQVDPAVLRTMPGALRAHIRAVGTGWASRAPELWDDVLRDAWRVCAPRDASVLRILGQDLDTAWARVWGPVEAALVARLPTASTQVVPDEGEEEQTAPGRRVSLRGACWPAADLVGLAHLDALRQAGSPAAARAEGILRLARSAGWWWPFERICIVAERPRSLHRDSRGMLHHESGPALAWPDGFGVWSWHGVVVPRDVIEEPGRLTIARIHEETDPDVRQVMVERYGPERYLRAAGAQSVGTDEEGALWRVDVPGGEPLAIVRMPAVPSGAGSPRAGHRWRCVPGDVRTPREAVALVESEELTGRPVGLGA